MIYTLSSDNYVIECALNSSAVIGSNINATFTGRAPFATIIVNNNRYTFTRRIVTGNSSVSNSAYTPCSILWYNPEDNIFSAQRYPFVYNRCIQTCGNSQVKAQGIRSCTGKGDLVGGTTATTVLQGVEFPVQGDRATAASLRRKANVIQGASNAGIVVGGNSDLTTT